MARPSRSRRGTQPRASSRYSSARRIPVTPGRSGLKRGGTPKQARRTLHLRQAVLLALTQKLEATGRPWWARVLVATQHLLDAGEARRLETWFHCDRHGCCEGGGLVPPTPRCVSPRYRESPGRSRREHGTLTKAHGVSATRVDPDSGRSRFCPPAYSDPAHGDRTRTERAPLLRLPPKPRRMRHHSSLGKLCLY